MSNYGISDNGFVMPTLQELITIKTQQYKNAFGENILTDESSAIGQLIAINAETELNLYQLAQSVYLSNTRAGSSGITLDNLVAINNTQRNLARATTAQLTLTGDPAATVPAGTTFSTFDTGDIFTSDYDVVIPQSGSAVVSVTANQTGAILALAGTITRVDQPITGLLSVINNTDGVVGSDIETDAQLRARDIKKTGSNSTSVNDGIVAAVAGVAGVSQVKLFENDTDSVNADGIPARHFQVLAVGGDPDQIAQSIGLKKPSGIPTFGNTSGNFVDQSGVTHVMNFSRPDTIDIYVTVNLTTDLNYPANGDDLIKAAIVDYANFNLTPDRGFGLADDVRNSRLYTPVNTVTGHEIDSILLSTSPAPTSENTITITATQVARFLTQNIQVNT